MKTFRWIKILTILLAMVAIGYILWLLIPAGENADYKTREARIKSISRMVELCTTDIHEEIAVKDSVNGKWIVARQTVEGRIRFNLDSLKIEDHGDTTFVYLPPERVDILEGAEPGDYEVLDSWDGNNTLFAKTLTADEENRIKKRWEGKVRQRIYDRGYVRQARKNAVASLTPLFRGLQGPAGKQTPVVILDP